MYSQELRKLAIETYIKLDYSIADTVAEFDGLPDDVEALRDMLREAKLQLRRTQLELDVRQATLETAKKTRAPTRSC